MGKVKGEKAKVRMKDSGIEWIGEIPEGWEIRKNKYNFMLNKRLVGDNWKRMQLLSLTKNGIKAISEEDQKGKVPTSFATYQHVNKNDVVMCLFDLDVSAVFSGVSPVNGMISPAYKCFKCNDDMFSQYVGYYYQTVFVDRKYKRYSKNVRYSLSADEFMALPMLVPPLSEQQRIADFLDAKCSEIDSLSADIQAQIETLQAYKRSVITEAVTGKVKGEKGKVRMRDSGIEWIGEIPEGWEVTRIKYLFTSGKGLNITKENLTEEGLPVISYGQIHAKNNNGVNIRPELLRFVDYDYQKRFPQCAVDQFDFVFADTSEDYDGCGNCVYKRDDSILFAGYHTIILHSNSKQDNRFLAFLFQTDKWRKQIRSAVSGVKVFSITQKTIMNASVILPSFEEQQTIADFLDTKCSEIDSIIAQKREQLLVLADYKKSIIYEYVTGKKQIEN